MATTKRTRGNVGSDNLPKKPEVRKVKVTIRLSTLQRLKVEALGLGDIPIGQLLDQLVAERPVRFVLQERGRGVPGCEMPASPPTIQAQEPTQGRTTLGLHSESA